MKEFSKYIGVVMFSLSLFYVIICVVMLVRLPEKGGEGLTLTAGLLIFLLIALYLFFVHLLDSIHEIVKSEMKKRDNSSEGR